MHREMIYIALGSNLGNSRKLILDAMDKLELQIGDTLVRSSLWHSRPVDCPEGTADFVNAVVGYEIPEGENPMHVLLRLQALETEFGRPPTHERNSPRCLDLDIVCVGAMVMNTPDLVIPHPRAKERAFVLLPLQEIAPKFVFPDSGMSVNELVAKVSSAGVVRI